MKRIAEGLEKSLQSLISQPIKRPGEALALCTQLENLYRTSSNADTEMAERDPQEARNLLRRVLDQSQLSSQDLHSYFLLSPRPSSEAAGMVLDSYKKQGSALPLNIAMIPFREATYNCEFEQGFRIMDKTTGKESLADKLGESTIRKLALGWSTGVCGILVGADQLLTSGLIGDWGSSKPMVLTMVFAYLSAISTYGVLALGGRNNDRSVSWVAGTPLTWRFKFKRNLEMASTLAQMNANLPENQNECAPKMIQELRERQFQPVETADEEAIKEYWARGGEGFDWVEPDQDPAEIIWKEKMDARAQKRIGSPYVRNENGQVQTWARSILNIEENRTIPHASLVDMDTLRGPEKMKELEEELRRLQQEVNHPDIDGLQREFERLEAERDEQAKSIEERDAQVKSIEERDESPGAPPGDPQK